MDAMRHRPVVMRRAWVSGGKSGVEGRGGICQGTGDRRVRDRLREMPVRSVTGMG